MKIDPEETYPRPILLCSQHHDKHVFVILQRQPAQLYFLWCSFVLVYSCLLASAPLTRPRITRARLYTHAHTRVCTHPPTHKCTCALSVLHTNTRTRCVNCTRAHTHRCGAALDAGRPCGPGGGRRGRKATVGRPRRWARPAVGRGRREARAGVLHFVALCIMLCCMLCCILCCSVVPAVGKGRREAQVGIFCRCLFLHYISLFCGSFV